MVEVVKIERNRPDNLEVGVTRGDNLEVLGLILVQIGLFRENFYGKWKKLVNLILFDLTTGQKRVVLGPPLFCLVALLGYHHISTGQESYQVVKLKGERTILC